MLAALGAGAAIAAPRIAAAQDEPGALERIRRRGRLVVGVYHDLPPFHVAGRGIESELGAALAQRLGLEVSWLPFHADESMEDDLRNVVWRGHFLGWGPADVMLHVPVDRRLAEANPRVQLIAPYWRERVAIARRVDAVPALDSLSALKGQPVAVAGQSLAGWLLIGADNGMLRDTLVTRLSDGVAAAGALRDGQVVAAAGFASELEHALGRDARFAITPLPAPRAPKDGWAVGMAVKRDASDLAEALQRATGELTASGQLAGMFEQHGVRWRL